MFTEFLGNAYDDAVAKFESDSATAYLMLSNKCHELEEIQM
jgi:hypothetical protein